MYRCRQFGVFAVGLVAWLTSSVSLEAQKSKGPEDPQKVRRIQPAELQKMLAKDQAILVDVRSRQSFERGHMAGAINMPAGEIEQRAADLRRLAGSRTLVLYCSCAFEHTAAEAAVRLARLGISRVSVLKGGYVGLPETSAPNFVQERGVTHTARDAA
jgi:rhodanese-related sulfurtransferase